MILKDKVCTIQQSKRLLEHGVNTPSMHMWVQIDNILLHTAETAQKLFKHAQKTFGDECRMKLYPAYDVAELGEMLPELSYTAYSNELKQWIGKCEFPNEIVQIERSFFKTEAIARAELLIKLLDENLIDPKHIK